MPHQGQHQAAGVASSRRPRHPLPGSLAHTRSVPLLSPAGPAGSTTPPGEGVGLGVVSETESPGLRGAGLRVKEEKPEASRLMGKEGCSGEGGGRSRLDFISRWW